MLPFIPLAIFAVAGYGIWRYFNPVAAASVEDVAAETITNIGETVNQVTEKITDLFPKAAPYEDAINTAQNKYGIPGNILAKLLNAESAFRPDIISGAKRSSTGATGIAQFMPATANDYGINPTDPIASIDAAGRYLSDLNAKFGDWTQAVAAYNWGQGNVERKGLTNAPAETINYVQKILGVDITKGV